MSGLERKAMVTHGMDSKTESVPGCYPLSTDYPLDSCLHELIEAQVERSPESVTLLFEQQRLSYREMNARANQWRTTCERSAFDLMSLSESAWNARRR
jgi:non-ribosomal peptide synthetase component F